MLKRIHINQHIIRSNNKNGERKPVITVKAGKENVYCDRVIVDGITEIVYSPDKPLSCGAKVWIETTDIVECYEKVKGKTRIYEADFNCKRVL
jgi:hypothetical protein